MIARRLAAELVGTALLLLVIVGSGVAASVDGPTSVQLFMHAVAVGVGLTALILTFGHVSGGHFNPAVTLVDSVIGDLPRRLAGAYVVAQLAGATIGVVIANLMFELPAVELASTERLGVHLALSEGVATFGLLVVIYGVVHSGRAAAVPAAVGAWIAAAIFATSSAAFANPAVTIARTLTDSYTGMAPNGVLPYVAAQAVGATAAALLVRWLFPTEAAAAVEVIVPHES